jgi:hypothetical protein
MPTNNYVVNDQNNIPEELELLLLLFYVVTALTIVGTLLAFTPFIAALLPFAILMALKVIAILVLSAVLVMDIIGFCRAKQAAMQAAISHTAEISTAAISNTEAIIPKYDAGTQTDEASLDHDLYPSSSSPQIVDNNQEETKSENTPSPIHSPRNLHQIANQQKPPKTNMNLLTRLRPFISRKKQPHNISVGISESAGIHVDDSSSSHVRADNKATKQQSIGNKIMQLCTFKVKSRW